MNQCIDFRVWINLHIQSLKHWRFKLSFIDDDLLIKFSYSTCKFALHLPIIDQNCSVLIFTQINLFTMCFAISIHSSFHRLHCKAFPNPFGHQVYSLHAPVYIWYKFCFNVLESDFYSHCPLVTFHLPYKFYTNLI